jgi:hypothetical protein
MTQEKRKKEYQPLLKELSGVGWISDGYAQNRGRGAGGPCFQWTRKVKGKTVSVALSEEQFEALTEAIESWQKTKKILKRMQQLSREEIFTHIARSQTQETIEQEIFRHYLSAIPPKGLRSLSAFQLSAFYFSPHASRILHLPSGDHLSAFYQGEPGCLYPAHDASHGNGFEKRNSFCHSHAACPVSRGSPTIARKEDSSRTRPNLQTRQPTQRRQHF